MSAGRGACAGGSTGSSGSTGSAGTPVGPARWAPAAAVLLVAAALVVAGLALVPWSVLGPGAPPVRLRPGLDFTAAQRAADTAFHRDLRAWTYPRFGLQLAVVLWLAGSGAGARLVGRLRRGLHGWVPAVAVGTLLLSAVPVAVGVPFGVGAERVLRRAGLSTEAWGAWAADVVRGWAVAAVPTAAVLLLAVALARRWRTWWWVPAAVLAAGLAVAGSVLEPVLVEPLANTFTPLPAGPQRTALLRLADRAGVPVRDVLVDDASRRTTAENAYVSGLGATRRLVVDDTLLRGASPRDVQLVVAHELGHAAHHDVRAGTVLGALGAAGVPPLLVLLGRRRWRRALPRPCHGPDDEPVDRGVADPRSVALVLAFVAAGTVLAAPVTNLVSRRVEAHADVFAMTLTRDPAGFAAMQRRLALADRVDLDPRWYRELLFETHPSPAARVATARAFAVQHHLPAPTTPATMGAAMVAAKRS